MRKIKVNKRKKKEKKKIKKGAQIAPPINFMDKE